MRKNKPKFSIFTLLFATPRDREITCGFIKRLLALAVAFALCGCAKEMTWNLAFAPLLPIPIPWYDAHFHSVAYYKTQYGVDLLKQNHDMQAQIERNHRAIDGLNHAFRLVNLSVQGQQINAPYGDDEYFRGMKKLGPNEYQVGRTLHDVAPMEIQEKATWCWAASLKYFISSEYKIDVSQQRIVEEVKHGESSGDQAANIVEVMGALGLSGSKVSSDGGRQLVSALSLDHVAILGTSGIDDNMPHVVVVVGAKFAFVDPVSPRSQPKDGVAFTEIAYLNPSPHAGNGRGMPITRSAEDFDGKVSFILTRDYSGR